MDRSYEEIIRRLGITLDRAIVVKARVPSWVAAACLSAGMGMACTPPKANDSGPTLPAAAQSGEPDAKGDLYNAPPKEPGTPVDVCHECAEYMAPPMDEPSTAYGGPPTEDE